MHKYGFTSLHYAVHKNNNLDLIKLLIQKGAHLNIKN